MESAILFYGGVILSGALLGASFVVLWRIAVPRGATRRVAGDLTEVARGMATADDTSAFLSLYGRLLSSVGGYLLRNVIGLVLACAPIVLVLAFLTSPVLESWGRRADFIDVYPPRFGDQLSVNGQASLILGEASVEVENPTGRTALCWSTLLCLQFELLGFEVQRFSEPLANASYVVVRPRHGDEDLLWPIISNLEAAFFIAFALSTMICILLPARRR